MCAANPYHTTEGHSGYTYTLDVNADSQDFVWYGHEEIKPAYYRDVWILIDKDVHKRANFNKNVCYDTENNLHVGNAYISYGQYFHSGFIIHIGWPFAGMGETFGDYEELVDEKDGTLIRIKVPMIDSNSNKIRFKVAYWSRLCDYLAIQGNITLPINYRNSKDNPMIFDYELIKRMELYHTPLVDCSGQDGWFTIDGCEVLDEVKDLKIVDE